MKIAFLWHFDKAPIVFHHWRDGLRAAIEIIGRKHQVLWFVGEDVNPPQSTDYYLLWDDANSPAIAQFAKRGRVGLCLTTDLSLPIENLRLLDAVFCESNPVYEKVKQLGVCRAIKAFGTDTTFFTPAEEVVKDIEYFYPATFSPWKLQRNIAHLGKRLLCVGTVQPDGYEDYNACEKAGCRINEGYFSVEKVREYYRRAQKVIIPAIHGSERTVLESMSMGIRPEVNPENKKAFSYIEELDKSGMAPRDFVVKHYSEQRYAEQLLKGIEKR